MSHKSSNTYELPTARSMLGCQSSPSPSWCMEPTAPKTDADRLRRLAFVEELCRDVPVHPVTLEIARAVGRIDGQQAAKGVSVAFEDLAIGVTALELGFDVATLNVRHFQMIPGLKTVSL